MHRLTIQTVALLAGLCPVLLPGQDYRAAADYSKSLDGLAVLIYQNDKIVFEEYHNG